MTTSRTMTMTGKTRRIVVFIFVPVSLIVLNMLNRSLSRPKRLAALSSSYSSSWDTMYGNNNDAAVWQLPKDRRGYVVLPLTSLPSLDSSSSHSTSMAAQQDLPPSFGFNKRTTTAATWNNNNNDRREQQHHHQHQQQQHQKRYDDNNDDKNRDDATVAVTRSSSSGSKNSFKGAALLAVNNEQESRRREQRERQKRLKAWLAKIRRETTSNRDSYNSHRVFNRRGTKQQQQRQQLLASTRSIGVINPTRTTRTATTRTTPRTRRASRTSGTEMILSSQQSSSFAAQRRNYQQQYRSASSTTNTTTVIDIHPACKSKKRSKAVRVLRSSGLTYMLGNESLCNALPTDDEIDRLYGSEPIIHGLDTCERYRSMIAAQRHEQRWGEQQGQPIIIHTPRVRVLGLFNSGTNFFQESLKLNLGRIDPRANMMCPYYDVPWGKHVPAHHKYWNNWPRQRCQATARFKDMILPVIVIRDPYRWMQSMCKTWYDAHWNRGENGTARSCPNLVNLTNPGRADYPVRVNPGMTGYRLPTTYASLADYWSEFNRGYYDARYPRLFVRFEDLLFHSERIMDEVLECAGLPPPSKPFRYFVNLANKQYIRHPEREANGLIKSLIKYGKEHGRYDNYTRMDLDFATDIALDETLTNLFHYPPPPPPPQSSSAAAA